MSKSGEDPGASLEMELGCGTIIVVAIICWTAVVIVEMVLKAQAS